MIAAAQLSPRALGRVRGPGTWQPWNSARAFARLPTAALPGRWLDTGTLPGFVAFALLAAGLLTFAQQLLPISPYRALLVVLGASALLPIFCTGRASELPADPAAMPRPLLRWLARKLSRAGISTTPLARIPDGSTEPDELRLLIHVPRGLPGLLALEVGLEYQQGGGGPVSMPCVLVRVVDGSESYRALPRNVVWTRGRASGERVTVLRPRLPTRSQCLSLVLRLEGLLGRKDSGHKAVGGRAKPAPAHPAASLPIVKRRIAFSRAPQGSSNAAMSSGKSSSTLKPAISPSPVQAT
jgi:hypothetical protein